MFSVRTNIGNGARDGKTVKYTLYSNKCTNIQCNVRS